MPWQTWSSADIICFSIICTVLDVAPVKAASSRPSTSARSAEPPSPIYSPLTRAGDRLCETPFAVHSRNPRSHRRGRRTQLSRPSGSGSTAAWVQWQRHRQDRSRQSARVPGRLDGDRSLTLPGENSCCGDSAAGSKMFRHFRHTPFERITLNKPPLTIASTRSATGSATRNFFLVCRDDRVRKPIRPSQ